MHYSGKGEIVFIDNVSRDKIAHLGREALERVHGYLVDPDGPHRLHDILSPLTMRKINSVNQILSNKVFGTWMTIDSKDIADDVEERYLVNEYYNDHGKYYELFPLGHKGIFIVVYDGFYPYITESKENHREFYLACLSESKKYDVRSDLVIKSYIRDRLESSLQS